MLDLSDALDPEFMQSVVRVQRIEVINAYGETTTTSVRSTIQAVVTSGSKQGIMRFEDMQTYADTIKVITAGPLNAPTVGGQPDQILWRGQTYIVAIANDYQGFGYTRAICKLTDPQGANNG